MPQVVLELDQAQIRIRELESIVEEAYSS